MPGLAENRPSVLVGMCSQRLNRSIADNYVNLGDRILIQPHGSDIQRGRWFEGCVHVVRREEVGMKFAPSFHWGHAPNRLYRVRFKLNRYPLRRQHQALDTAFSPSRLLFPTAAHVLQDTPPNTVISVHNHLISQNPPQLQAVKAIAKLPPGSPPFVVFGP